MHYPFSGMGKEQNIMPQNFIYRINRTIDYINDHLDNNISIEKLADISHLSKSHFQRVFKSIVGEPANQYIKRLRLEKTLKLLIFNPSFSISEVSERCGYSTCSNFSKLFKQYYGLAPSEIRKYFHYRNIDNFYTEAIKNFSDHIFISKINLDVLYDSQTEIIKSYFGMNRFEELSNLRNVQVLQIPDLRVMYSRYVGPLKVASEIHPTDHRLNIWGMAFDLKQPDDFTSYGIILDRAEFTPPDKCRYDAAFEITPDTVISNEVDVNIRKINGGTYAKFRVEASCDDNTMIWRLLFSQWLAKSSFEIDDRPQFQRHIFKKECNPWDSMVTEFYMPIKSA